MAAEPSGARWRNTVAMILARDGYTCRVPRDGAMCARPAVTADHVVPPPAGGPVYDPDNLRAACLESGVKLIACQMTVDLFGFQRSDFIAEVADFCGATTFLPMAQKADVSLFI